jgi:hypothetical protein
MLLRNVGNYLPVETAQHPKYMNQAIGVYERAYQPQCVPFIVSLSAACVLEYPADAGFLCDRAAEVREADRRDIVDGNAFILFDNCRMASPAIIPPRV